MSDGSFHQHGPQLYSGWGYGGIFSTNVLLYEEYAAGTSLASTEQQWDIFANLVLVGQQLATRGPNFDYTVSGRLMTYFGRNDTFGVNDGWYHFFAAFDDFRLAFPRFVEPFDTPLGVFFHPLLSSVDPERPRAQELVAFGRRLYGESAPALNVNHHFYDSDFHAHHRPGYYASVRMFSNRTLNTECVNSENLQGRDLADGVTNVYLSGKEYEDVYAVWDWQLIPGTLEHRTGTTYTCAGVSLKGGC